MNLGFHWVWVCEGVGDFGGRSMLFDYGGVGLSKWGVTKAKKKLKCGA